LVVQELRMLAIFDQILDFLVELWNLQFKIFLVLFSISVQATLNFSKLCLQSQDLLTCILNRIIVFFLNLESEVFQNTYDLII